MRVTVRRPDGEAVELRIEGITTPDEDVARVRPVGQEPTPEELLAASLASCTATTMDLYARRKGWQVGEVDVDVDYTPAQRGSPTRCAIVVRLPEHLSPERRERLMQVGATSRIHRVLEGEIAFNERLEVRTAPEAPLPDRRPQARRRPIAVVNGLRGALRIRRGDAAPRDSSPGRALGA